MKIKYYSDPDNIADDFKSIKNTYEYAREILDNIPDTFAEYVWEILHDIQRNVSDNVVLDLTPDEVRRLANRINKKL